MTQVALAVWAYSVASRSSPNDTSIPGAGCSGCSHLSPSPRRVRRRQGQEQEEGRGCGCGPKAQENEGQEEGHGADRQPRSRQGNQLLLAGKGDRPGQTASAGSGAPGQGDRRPGD